MAQLSDQIEAYAAASQPALRSVLVTQKNDIILERYWHGGTAQSRQPIFSITKSVLSTLVGLAQADGKLSLDDTLAHWFPNWALSAHARSVTLRHLLTMTAGFDRTQPNWAGSDLMARLLARNRAALPGQRFRYNDDDPDVLAAILERAVGMPVLDYA